MSYRDPAKQAEYCRQWMRRRRLAWLESCGPCRHCGSTKNIELDHIDPDQKISHAIWSWSESRRLEELAKCQPLCHECHKKKTNAFNRDRLKGKSAKVQRLTEEEVLDIISMRATHSARDIASIYGISHSVVSRICNGKRMTGAFLSSQCHPAPCDPQDTSKRGRNEKGQFTAKK